VTHRFALAADTLDEQSDEPKCSVCCFSLSMFSPRTGLSLAFVGTSSQFQTFPQWIGQDSNLLLHTVLTSSNVLKRLTLTVGSIFVCQRVPTTRPIQPRYRRRNQRRGDQVVTRLAAAACSLATGAVAVTTALATTGRNVQLVPLHS
jgi:hypothetical protein